MRVDENMLWFCVVAADHKHLSPSMSYLGGAIAGSAATIGSYPFDLLRTILACQGEPKVTILEACHLSIGVPMILGTHEISYAQLGTVLSGCACDATCTSCEYFCWLFYAS